MAIAKVSKKGWVVIPHDIRERYGIRPGDKVQVVASNGVIRLIPLPKDPIEHGFGLLKGGPSLTQALLEDRREDLEREERGLSPPRTQ
ncbi:MAG: AbrB/MazE/SpoVT family DNA-binding domain-containing protein [Chloroflexota bacterium]|nr:AbrB/MazE/SpoVT family DNA-binding domain-containing protein [Chloroflexota bacterium]